MLAKTVIEEGVNKFLIMELNGKQYVRAYASCDKHYKIAAKFAEEAKVGFADVRCLGGGEVWDCGIHVTPPRIMLSKRSADYGGVPIPLRDFLNGAVQEFFPNHIIDDSSLAEY